MTPDNLGLGTVNPNIDGNITGGTNNFIRAITSTSSKDLLVSGVENSILAGSGNLRSMDSCSLKHLVAHIACTQLFASS